jgi:hypothetical protein
MVNVADAEGVAGVKGVVEFEAGLIAYVAADGAFTVTTAKRIEPSGQRVLTSVWVASVPTCSPADAAPCGSAWPNVAHPAVSVIDATVVCAHALDAALSTNSNATHADHANDVADHARRFMLPDSVDAVRTLFSRPLAHVGPPERALPWTRRPARPCNPFR